MHGSVASCAGPGALQRCRAICAFCLNLTSRTAHYVSVSFLAIPVSIRVSAALETVWKPRADGCSAWIEGFRACVELAVEPAIDLVATQQNPIAMLPVRDRTCRGQLVDPVLSASRDRRPPPRPSAYSVARPLSRARRPLRRERRLLQPRQSIVASDSVSVDLDAHANPRGVDRGRAKALPRERGRGKPVLEFRRLARGVHTAAPSPPSL